MAIAVLGGTLPMSWERGKVAVESLLREIPQVHKRLLACSAYLLDI